MFVCDAIHLGSQVQIKQLTLDSWNDFEQLFSSCEPCRECWCLNHRMKPSEVVTGDCAKSKMRDLVSKGQVGRPLGYLDGKCVAWLSVDPLNTQLGHDYVWAEYQIPESTWTIHCVYVAQEHRGIGFSKELTQAGIEFAKLNGARDMVAFPIHQDTQKQFPKDGAKFSGRHSTYRNLGFGEKERISDFYQVMRLEL